MTLGFLLDIVIAALLGTTIFYCWRLNRRLAALRQGREELNALVQSLTEATKKAEAGIGQLKEGAKEANAELKKNVDSAVALRDELSLITETGNNLANRLEARLTNGGGAAPAPSIDLEAERKSRSASRDADDGGARAHILQSLRQAR